MWEILRCYGLPDRLIQVVKNLYKNSLCAVNISGTLSNWLKVILGVRQGCLLSPLLFAIVIDWIMRTFNKKTPKLLEQQYAKDVHQENQNCH